jgi:hypothetical protein
VKRAPESFPIETDPVEQEYQALSDKEKFEHILSLFGTKVARDNFIDTCKKYIAERRTSSGSGRSEYSETGHIYSPPKRADLHNAIMDTLKRLVAQTKKIDPVTEKVLREVASREAMALITQEWVSAEEYGEDEDEDHRARKGTSWPTAFFHSRGGD